MPTDWTLKLEIQEGRWRLRDSTGELQGSWAANAPEGFEGTLRRAVHTFEKATGEGAVVRLDDSISRARSWVVTQAR